MRARLLCVGKPRNPHAIALHDDFVGRIAKLGLDFHSGWVAEEKGTSRYSDDHVRARESRRLSDALEKGMRTVVIDRRGRALDSESLAARLERWATPSVALLLGGPLGHHDDLLEQADDSWSLGPPTLPHELARVVVVEQLYRAMTILRGIPYHK